MNLREFVTEDQIKANFAGREDLPVWDTELSEDDVTKLKDEAYIAKLEEEHVEFQAWMTARYGNSKYRPDELSKRLGIPEHHVWAFLAMRGRTGKGIY